MPHPTAEKVVRFYRELRRRKVIRSALAYGVVGWLVIEVSSTILPAFGISDWVFQAIVSLVFLGFPVAMFLSWYFDIAPDDGGHSDSFVTSGDDLLIDDFEETDSEPVAIAVDLGKSHRAPVTVLYCAFGVATSGDEDLAAEELAERLPALNKIIGRVVDQYQGHRIESSDEEINLVFGYPIAHEDDARRAVAAGQQIIRSVNNMSAAGGDTHQVSVRIAIHSGMVVAETDDELSSNARLIGPTSRVAAWLGTLTNAGSILVTEETFKLVSNFFLCTERGEQTELHTGKKFQLYEVIRSTESEARMNYLRSSTRAIVGRDHEIQLLKDCWANNESGDGQFVVLRGGPGIGKSAIVSTFCQYVEKRGNGLLVPCFCSPFEINRPLHPIIDYMHSEGLGHVAANSPEQSFRLLCQFANRVGISDGKTIGLLATLLSIPLNEERYIPKGAPGMIRKQMLESILLLLESAAESRPVLMIIEDLHWADPSTIELVNMIVKKGPSKGLFCLFTTRPEFGADWQSSSQVMQLDLRSLSQQAVVQLIKTTVGDSYLPQSLIAKIVQETGGIPLFAEELTKSAVEYASTSAGTVSDKLTSFEDFEIPATLKQSLASRIDNLKEAKSLLQLCSMIGREFDYRMLLAISKTENEEALRTELDSIVRAGMLFQNGLPPTSVYTFKHILFQESAYDSLLRKTRVELHRSIAETLETEFPDVRMRQPQMLARHFEVAGLHKKAIKYWTNACVMAVEASANAEAAVYADRGLASCQEIEPSTERDSYEVALHSMRGKALLATLGYTDPSVEVAFARALAICEKLGDTPKIFQIMGGLWMYYAVSAQFKEALQLGKRLLRIARNTNDPCQHVQARYCIAFTTYYLGDNQEAHKQLLQALEAEVPGHDYSSTSASGDDTRVHVLCLLSQVLWHLGSLRSSLDYSIKAVEIAKKSNHPYGLAYTGFMNAMLHQLRNEPEKVRSYAEPALAVAKDKGYRYWQILNQFMLAWADCEIHTYDSPELSRSCFETMTRCVNEYREIGAGTGLTYLQFLLTEKHIELGEFREARKWLHLAEKDIENTNEINFASEYLRLKLQVDNGLNGLSSTQRRDPEEVISGLQESIQMARERGSVMLELRSTRDLANYAAQDEAVSKDELVELVLDRFAERDTSCDRFKTTT